MQRTLLGALWLVLLLPSPARSCRIYLDLRTLRQEVAEASAVLCVKLARATPPNPDGPGGEGVTDFIIEKTLKKHPVLAGRDILTYPHYLPPKKGVPQRFLLFVDIDNKGRPDPYRGIPLGARSDLPRYVEGILKIKDKKTTVRLRFYFDYLHHAEEEIASDAEKEFEKADYKDCRAVAETLPADWLRAWLRDPATRPRQLGLYASLLGHCSKNKAADAKLLRSLVEDPARRAINARGIDGLLAACVMLQPKEGWEYLRGILLDPRQDFLMRYAALRAVRFFGNDRSDIIARKDSVLALNQLLDQEDIADLAIEDLHKWKCWDVTDRILALKDKESYDVAIIRRATLRFALCSPQKAAKACVEEQRKRDEQSVLDAEELLKFEQSAPPPVVSK
jgi:hypothetical protein